MDDLITTIRTMGAVRSFTDEPVSDGTLHAILDDARFAPSGGNRQPWKVAVVQDRGLRHGLAVLMHRVWDEYCAIAALGATPFGLGAPTSAPRVDAPNPMLDHIADIPVVLAIAADRTRIATMDGELARPPVTTGASIYPFCWNILLAARARGLGGVLTTFLSREEVAAAPLLGLPPDHALVATIFLGHPTHQNTKLRRRPVESFTTIDRFDGEEFALGR